MWGPVSSDLWHWAITLGKCRNNIVLSLEPYYSSPRRIALRWRQSLSSGRHHSWVIVQFNIKDNARYPMQNITYQHKGSFKSGELITKYGFEMLHVNLIGRSVPAERRLQCLQLQLQFQSCRLMLINHEKTTRVPRWKYPYRKPLDRTKNVSTCWNICWKSTDLVTPTNK